MKIVLAPVGSDGDIRPMIAFGIVQRDKGHNVLICAPPNYKDICEKYEFDFRQVGADVKEIMIQNADRIAGQQWENDFLLYSFLKKGIADQFKVLHDAAKDADYILGSGLHMAGQSISEIYNIPYRHVLHTPQILESAEHPPPMITKHNLPKWMNRSFWLMYKTGINFLLRGALNHQRKTYGLPPVKDIHRYITRKMIISAYENIARVPDDIKVDCIQTSYWYLEEDTPLPDDLLQFIGAGEKPVYIGFGSIPESKPDEITRIIDDIVNALDIRLVVSKGWADLAKGLKSERIKVIEFVPHHKLFPLMAAVVHHGGAGTTNTAARCGVPQVIVPYVLDQYYHGHRIHKLRLGTKPVNRLKLNSRKLIAAVKDVLENNEYSENAHRLGNVLKTVPGVEKCGIETLFTDKK